MEAQIRDSNCNLQCGNDYVATQLAIIVHNYFFGMCPYSWLLVASPAQGRAACTSHAYAHIYGGGGPRDGLRRACAAAALRLSLGTSTSLGTRPS